MQVSLCIVPCLPSVFALRIDMRIRAEPGLRGTTGGVLWQLTGGVSFGLLPWWCARHWYLPATEDFDDAHGATATGARFAQGEWDDLGIGC